MGASGDALWQLEFAIRDPNGYILSFGQDIATLVEE
jgi:hypothetical protein